MRVYPTIIHRNRSRDGVPGPGFIGWPLDDIGTAHELVFAYDWSQVANPYEAFGVMDTPESLAHSLVENPENREDVYAKVKVRGIAQTVFKKALMLAYRGNAPCASLASHKRLMLLISSLGPSLLPANVSTRETGFFSAPYIIGCSMAALLLSLRMHGFILRPRNGRRSLLPRR